ncbi:MAG: 3-phosphoshikimate 1-carboxyvinyltransferase [Christensenellales bacterium]|jgi:3-phosphoshikimate 1-carboxyvinyltransferase
MTVTLKPRKLRGQIADIIASKSMAHRVLICAALADSPTEIECNSTSGDIMATIDALRALSAGIEIRGNVFRVRPISDVPNGLVNIHCGESGSTLRFLLPVIGALGVHAVVIGGGRLAQRPLSPLIGELTAHGMIFAHGVQNGFPLECSSRLTGSAYTIGGEVSSQFVTGLMFALAASGGGKIAVTGQLESRPYVEMTAAVLKQFGVSVEESGGIYTATAGKMRSPGRIRIEGDWSNAAFWLAAGALSDEGVSVSPLNVESVQGDREIARLLEKFGADVRVSGETVTVRRKALHGIEFDASDIPDLVPVLAVIAAAAEGTTMIRGVSRLRLKESDRIKSVYDMLTALGATVQVDDGEITVVGGRMRGGTVDSQNDHRIAMAAAIASAAADGDITIVGAEAVQKSYPNFFNEMRGLYNV